MFCQGPLCFKPILTIDDQRSFTNPMQIKRSKLFSIIVNIYFECSLDLSDVKEWTAYKLNNKLNENDPSSIELIDLSSNPTKSNSELVFKPNTLSYGIYKLNFKNTVTFNSNQQVYADITQYIEIIPTGIQIMAFENGINELSFGNQQDIELNPGLYSTDYDLLAQPFKLNFTFYCRPVNSNSIFQYFNKSASDSFQVGSGLVRGVPSCFTNSNYTHLHFI